MLTPDARTMLIKASLKALIGRTVFLSNRPPHIRPCHKSENQAYSGNRQSRKINVRWLEFTSRVTIHAKFSTLSPRALLGGNLNFESLFIP